MYELCSEEKKHAILLDKSSIIATPNIIEDASCFIRSNSSSILITMTVLVTEIANAKKRLLYTE